MTLKNKIKFLHKKRFFLSRPGIYHSSFVLAYSFLLIYQSVLLRLIETLLTMTSSYLFNSLVVFLSFFLFLASRSCIRWIYLIRFLLLFLTFPYSCVGVIFGFHWIRFCEQHFFLQRTDNYPYP